MESQILITYLEKIEFFYKINNEKFKSKAMINAIEIISKQLFIENGKEAMKLKGIGKGIAKKIDHIIINKSIPNQYICNKYKIYKLFLDIWGCGPIRASKWVNKGYSKLEDIPENEQTHAIKIGIKYYNDFKKKIPRILIEIFEKYLQKSEQFKKLQISMKISGSYRREKIESGDIDILIDKNISGFVSFLEESEYIIETLASGTCKFEGVIKLGSQACRIDIYQINNSKSWPFALLYFTGSKKLNIKMRNKAINKGYKLSEYGLEGYENNINCEINSEEDIFKALDMEFINPKNR